MKSSIIALALLFSITVNAEPLILRRTKPIHQNFIKNKQALTSQKQLLSKIIKIRSQRNKVLAKNHLYRNSYNNLYPVNYQIIKEKGL